MSSAPFFCVTLPHDAAAASISGIALICCVATSMRYLHAELHVAMTSLHLRALANLARPRITYPFKDAVELSVQRNQPL